MTDDTVKVCISERESVGRGGGRACIFVSLYASGLHKVEKCVLKLLAAVQIFCSQVFLVRIFSDVRHKDDRAFGKFVECHFVQHGPI